MKVGKFYTGNKYCFQGTIEPLEILEENNILRVRLTSRVPPFSWEEDWNLEHANCGLQKGEYIELSLRSRIVLMLERSQKRLESLINSTPTGEERNRMTEENIQILLLISELEIEEKIYYLTDWTHENGAEWIKGLNASGYAGMTSKGTIVDRREFPEATAIQANLMLGVVKPKKK